MNIRQLNEELSRILEEFSAQQLYLFDEFNEEYKVKISDLKNNLIHGKNYTIIDGGTMLLKNGFVDFSKVSEKPLTTNNTLEKKCKNIIQDMKPINKLSQEPVAIKKYDHISIYVYKVDDNGYVCINEDYAKWIQKEKIGTYILN